MIRRSLTVGLIDTSNAALIITQTNFYMAKVVGWPVFVDLLQKHGHSDYALILLSKLINQQIFNFPEVKWTKPGTVKEVR